MNHIYCTFLDPKLRESPLSKLSKAEENPDLYKNLKNPRFTTLIPKSKGESCIKTRIQEEDPRET